MTDSWLSVALPMKMFSLGQLASQLLLRTPLLGPELFINVASYTCTQFSLGFFPVTASSVWDIKILL